MGDVPRARQVLDDAAREFRPGTSFDRVFETANAVLRVIAARDALAPDEATALRAQARAKLDALPYPPPYLQRLAATAGLR